MPSNGKVTKYLAFIIPPQVFDDVVEWAYVSGYEQYLSRPGTGDVIFVAPTDSVAVTFKIMWPEITRSITISSVSVQFKDVIPSDKR